MKEKNRKKRLEKNKKEYRFLIISMYRSCKSVNDYAITYIMIIYSNYIIQSYIGNQIL